jgi:hypothetical protein
MGKMNVSSQALAGELVETGYEGFFFYGDDSAIDDIWDEPGNPERLQALILDDAISWPARFLAAEILFAKKEDFPTPELLPPLAAIYAHALAQTGVSMEDFYLPANIWGFLYELDDPGDAGQHFIDLGEAALPELIPLLDNEDHVLYEGSREATMGNEYNYRIKDFAAFYISKIKDIPIPFQPELEKRDREIEKLKQTLLD